MSVRKCQDRLNTCLTFKRELLVSLDEVGLGANELILERLGATTLLIKINLL